LPSQLENPVQKSRHILTCRTVHHGHDSCDRIKRQAAMQSVLCLEVAALTDGRTADQHSGSDNYEPVNAAHNPPSSHSVDVDAAVISMKAERSDVPKNTSKRVV